MGLTPLSPHYTNISEGFWDLCNFHLPYLHGVIMVDMNSCVQLKELIGHLTPPLPLTPFPLPTAMFEVSWRPMMMKRIYVAMHCSGAFVCGGGNSH